jgi:hypothetical protein
MVPGLEYRNPEECHVGKCEEKATVSVALQLRDYRAPLGEATLACAAHVREAAELLLAGIAHNLKTAADALERT